MARARRVATVGVANIPASLRDANTSHRQVPALKGRAKFIPTLRVEDTCSEVP